ncbi:aminotransferase class-III family protein, partial [Chlamydia psittaci 84-8471/1]
LCIICITLVIYP